jgi:hypothetical protein
MDLISARSFASTVPLDLRASSQGTQAAHAVPAGRGDEDFSFQPHDADNLILSQGDAVDMDNAAASAARFQEKAGLQAPAHVIPHPGDAVQKIKEAGRCMDAALKAGVDMTRSTFLRKAVGAVASVIALAVMAAATVATGGAAAPALAAACLSTLSYAGDAACAWREWRNAQADAAGQPPPYAPLPCGPSAVGNLAYWAASGLGQDHEGALSSAHKVEVAFAVGLLAFSLATCVVPPELKLAEEAAKFASLGLKSLMYTHATLSSAAAQEAEGDTSAPDRAPPARQLEQALHTLDHVLGPDDGTRQERLQHLLASHPDDAQLHGFLGHLMEDGRYSPQKAGRLLAFMEKAVEGMEPTHLNFLALTVNVVSFALVGRELAPPGAE